MTITHELTLDLKHKGELAHIEVVQGDAFTRQVDLMLQCGGEDWTIPVCDPVVRYCKPDGTGGIYDTLPDGQPAIVYAGNVLTLALAPQMLTCSGPVQVQVELNTQEKRLATFAFLVVVEPGVAPNRESEDYVNWNKAFLLQSTGAKAGQYLMISAVDADGRITEVEAADVPYDGAMEMALSARDLAQASDEKANTALRIAQDVAQEIEDYSPSGTRSIAEAAMRMADQRIIAPEQAAVGQYVRVTAVDADGKIIATETVDAPVGIPEGTVPVATADSFGGVRADPTTDEDTQPVRIGEDGKLWTAPGSHSGSGNSHQSGWVKLGDITVAASYEYEMLSAENGVITIDPNSKNYDYLISGNHNFVLQPIDLRKKETAQIGVISPADPAAGTFNICNRDGGVLPTTAFDTTNYKLVADNVGQVVIENVPRYDNYRLRVTTPVLSTSGLRDFFNSSMSGLGLRAIAAICITGGAMIEIQLVRYPSDDNYYYRNIKVSYGTSYGGSSTNEAQSTEMLASGIGANQPPVSGSVSFAPYHMIFVNGTRFELWGANDD